MATETRDSEQWLERFTFAELVARGILEVGDGYRAKNEELGGDGPIFLRAGHVSDMHIDFERVERFRKPPPAQLAAKTSRPGDVIVTTKGWSTGRVSFVSKTMTEFVYSPHLSYWRSLNADVLDAGFLRYWSRSPECQRQLGAVKMSIDIHPYLSLATQKTLHISLPPPNDQRAIAHILGTLDDKIDLLRRMNQTLEETARALFKSWFVDFDPVRAKAAGRKPSGIDAETAKLFPQSVIETGEALIPEGWTYLPLGQATAYLNRGIGPAYLDEGGVAVINQKCIRNHRLDISKARRHDPAAKSIIGREVRQFDVLVNSTGVGTLGRVAPVWGSIGLAVVDSHVTIVRANERIDPILLCFALIERETEIEKLGEGSTGQTELSRARLAALPLLLPEPRVQERFASAVSPLLKKLVVNERQVTALTETRDTLLPKLLSGALRIPEVERFLSSEAS